jgi:hypothetical protein
MGNAIYSEHKFVLYIYFCRAVGKRAGLHH